MKRPLQLQIATEQAQLPDSTRGNTYKYPSILYKPQQTTLTYQNQQLNQQANMSQADFDAAYANAGTLQGGNDNDKLEVPLPPSYKIS